MCLEGPCELHATPRRHKALLIRTQTCLLVLYNTSTCSNVCDHHPNTELNSKNIFSVVKLTGATTDATIAKDAVPTATALTICACDSDARGRTWVRGRMETAFTDALARTVMFILDGCLIYVQEFYEYLLCRALLPVQQITISEAVASAMAVVSSEPVVMCLVTKLWCCTCNCAFSDHAHNHTCKDQPSTSAIR